MQNDQKVPGGAGNSNNSNGDFEVFPSKQEQIDVQMRQQPAMHPFDQNKLDQHYRDYVNQPETGSLQGDLSRQFYGKAGYHSRGNKLNPLFILGPLAATVVVGGYLLLGWIFEPEKSERGTRRERTEAAEDGDGSNPFGVGPDDDTGGVKIDFSGFGSGENGGTGAGGAGGDANGGDGNGGNGGDVDTTGLEGVREPFILTDHNTLWFGHYPHTCNGASGQTLEQYYLDYMYDRDNWAENASDADAIEWIILEDRGDSLLLMSKEVLDVVPMGGDFAICYYDTLDDPENYDGYNKYDADPSIVTWENTTLRAWLNDEFIEYAFTDEEQQFLLEMTVDACGESAGMCNDYVTIPSSANLDKYMPHTGSGDYNFELVAQGTPYALYEQYRSFCGPYRDSDQSRADTGFRVLVRRYHGSGSNWAGTTLSGSEVEAAGCPSSLLNRQTVSYWIRDIDTQFYTGSSDYFDWLYSGKEGVYRVVTNDGRYFTTGYRITNCPGPYPFRNETNMTIAENYFTRFAGLRPVILVAKRSFVFGTARGGEPGTTGRPRIAGGVTSTPSPAPASPTEEKYTITFDPNGGTGYMSPVEVAAGPYTLPECTFRKRNADFDGWDLGDPGDVINVSSDLVVKATWEDQPDPESGAIGPVYFGYYEQDGNKANGKEPIEWDVLADNGSTVLLISTYVLDHPTFNEDYDRNEDTNWENCSLRTWLNDDFLNEAFDSDEISHIHRRKIVADANRDPSASSDPGGNTRDMVSILSLSELYTYYGDASIVERGSDIYSPIFMACPTNAILRSGSNPDGVTGRTINADASDKDFYRQNGYSSAQMSLTCYDWWLRTPGTEGSNSLYVGFDGCVSEQGMHAWQDPEDSPGVRPVIEVDASEISISSGINR